MRQKFSWYLNLESKELSKLWDTATLTLDANVLLDLYRYNKSTRDSILSSIEMFGKRVWISDQASNEFMKNRKSVASSADKTFQDATSVIDELEKNRDSILAKLKGHRLVPEENLTLLNKNLSEAIDEVRGSIDDAAKKHPDYLKKDDILDKILAIFDKRVGEAPSPEQYNELIKEAGRRVENKIPPGYLDADKDGDRKYGDYILWKQIIEYSKESKSPIVLVTSERKDDWWEKHSGKTVGPRMELIREFYEETGNRVLIYQTEQFLKHSSKKGGKEFNSDAAEEIRILSASRETPHYLAGAVQSNQTTEKADLFEESGTLEVDLARPVRNFAAAARLNQEAGDWRGSKVKLKLIDRPQNCPRLIIRSGFNSTNVVNIHAHSSEKGIDLPPGKYRFSYEVSQWDMILESLDDFAKSNDASEPE